MIQSRIAKKKVRLYDLQSSFEVLVRQSFEEALQILNVIFGAEEDRASLVDRSGLDIENALGTCGCHAACLLCEQRHGEGFVEHAQLAALGFRVCGVTKDASVEERTVKSATIDPM